MFYFRLAAHLGCTVGELLARCNSRELSEWMAYYSIEPFGQGMNSYMIASLMALTANMQTGKKGKKFDPDDFLPKRREKQNWQDMKALMQEAFGGG